MFSEPFCLKGFPLTAAGQWVLLETAAPPFGKEKLGLIYTVILGPLSKHGLGPFFVLHRAWPGIIARQRRK